MSSEPLQIDPISAFSDNYIWMLHRGGKQCVVVDPGDAAPVVETLEARGLKLIGILITHHHWDHAGGVPDLLNRWPDIPVFGPDDDRLESWNQPCKEGDEVKIDGLGLTFSVLDVPAHTRSHVAFYGHGCVFSGDTLFSVGCGRLFEGSPAEMQVAMDKLAELPGDTLVYCGHEYTQDNCRFALAVEPENEALHAWLAEVRGVRERNEPSLPSTLSRELAVNPFMRTREPTVIEAARKHDENVMAGDGTMAVIRAWKDRF